MSFWKPGDPKPTSTGFNTNKKQKDNMVLLSSKTPKKSKEEEKPNSAQKSNLPPPVLSDSVKKMKFMKRATSETDEADKQHQMIEALQGDLPIEENEPIQNNLSQGKVVSKSQTPFRCVKDNSDLYRALPGRKSFGGFNKVVEKHYNLIVQSKYQEKLEKMKTNDTITDEEMIDRYEELIGLPRGPNQGKRPASSLMQEKKNKKPKH